MQRQQQKSLHILLAAPTGKAAARLTQSIQQNQQRLQSLSPLAQQIPNQAHTLHRLLGMHRYTHQPRYHAANPLNCDVLVLDEASMIDQQMMSAVMAALPESARLILLGDKDQLSSVEAGSVFADLCGDLSQSSFSRRQMDYIRQSLGYDLPQYHGAYRLADQLVVLQQSRRFAEGSAIGHLAGMVNRGEAESTVQWLMQQQEREPSIHWHQPAAVQIAALLRQTASDHYQRMLQATGVAEAFAEFYRFQILAAVWDGPAGVDSINQVIDRELKSRNGIPADRVFYAGQPLMMGSNMYQYRIHNGDIGMVWPDEDDQLKVWFEGDDGAYRALSLSQLPAHNLAYAMTVHKSQGSEFNQVLLLLPDYDSAVSTRELLYTGITRAVNAVEIWSSAAVLEKTIHYKTRRISGLLARLSGQ